MMMQCQWRLSAAYTPMVIHSTASCRKAASSCSLLLGRQSTAAGRCVIEHVSRAQNSCVSWRCMRRVQVDLKWLEAHEAKALEPELRCVAALWSENTGIVDSKGYGCVLVPVRL